MKPDHLTLPLGLCGLCLSLIALGGRAGAQNYSVNWSTIDGGCGTSTGGVYSVTGTIGQPDAGAMSGGNYSIQGGFWGLITVVQTPGAPPLTITPAGANAIISWPSPSLGYLLQQNTDVANTNTWVNFGGTVNSNATTLSVTVPANAGNKYFRLKK